jgi:hypothetical protein
MCVSSKCLIRHGIIFHLSFTDCRKVPFFVASVPWVNCYKVLFCFYPLISKKIIFKHTVIQISTVTPCILATQNLNMDRKENWTCEDIYKQINLESKQNFTIYMKVLVPSHNLPHLKCSIGTKISSVCSGRPLEYNTIIIHCHSPFHFTVYSEWHLEN